MQSRKLGAQIEDCILDRPTRKRRDACKTLLLRRIEDVDVDYELDKWAESKFYGDAYKNREVLYEKESEEEKTLRMREGF